MIAGSLFNVLRAREAALQAAVGGEELVAAWAAYADAKAAADEVRPPVVAALPRSLPASQPHAVCLLSVVVARCEIICQCIWFR